MSTTLCRGTIFSGAVLVALLSANPVEAQHCCNQGTPCHHRGLCEPGGLWNNVATGVQYDLLNQEHAAKQLRHAESRLGNDLAQQNQPAASRESFRIARLQHRMRVNDWLIRYNTCQELTPYPNQVCLDPYTRAAIANASRPPGAPPIAVYWNGK